MKKVNRREFFEDSLFALAAAAAVSAAPVVAQERQPNAVSSNEKLGVAIVGMGGRSVNHVDAFVTDPRTIVLYLCDPDPRRGSPELLDKIAQRQGGIRPKYVADMRKTFEDPAVDLVSCAATNHWHTLCGLWALQHNKHCYLEKPISQNMHEGFALEAAIKKYGKIVQTGTQSRSDRAVVEALAFIRSGGIGETRFSRGLCYKRRKTIGPKGNYPIPEGVDYDLWSGPAQILPLTRKNFHYDWHWQREYGNGDIGNQGPHQTDMARYFLDLDRYPNSVVSYGGRLGYQQEMKDDHYIDAGDTANTEVSIYDYGDKCIVFETRGLETPALFCPQGTEPQAAAKIGVLVYGSGGYLVYSPWEHCAAFDLDGRLIKLFKEGGDELHFFNFIDAVVADDPSMLNAPAHVGVLSAAVSHMGNISYYLGENNKVSVSELRSSLEKIKSLDDNLETLDRTVAHLEENGVDLDKTPLSLGPQLAFDPEKQVFDHSEAQKLTTRDYRAGYVVPDAAKI